MEKIVIVTNSGDKDWDLIQLIEATFPECEISIVFLDNDNHEESQKGPLSGAYMNKPNGGGHGKHFDPR